MPVPVEVKVQHIVDRVEVKEVPTDRIVQQEVPVMVDKVIVRDVPYPVERFVEKEVIKEIEKVVVHEQPVYGASSHPARIFLFCGLFFPAPASWLTYLKSQIVDKVVIHETPMPVDRIVEKIVEVPKNTIIEHEVVKYVDRYIDREVIKEVPVEKIIVQVWF